VVVLVVCVGDVFVGEKEGSLYGVEFVIGIGRGWLG
jgi:hypothetical protein